MSDSLHDIPLHTLDGQPTTLAAWRGQVLLIVNVASACGLTPQYTGLQALHERYASKGLAVLGFPCNQFGAQEPGSAEQIAEFCSTRYAVGFSLFAKGDVNGPATQPLFAWLKAHAPGPDGADDIRWNFGKFLVGRDGQVLQRIDPRTTPEALVPAIEAALG